MTTSTPEKLTTYPPQAERVTTLLMQLAALKEDNTTLLGALSDLHATWAPLRARYEHEMAGRRRARFAVESLPEWIKYLAGRLGGDVLQGEDPGAVNDATQDGE